MKIGVLLLMLVVFVAPPADAAPELVVHHAKIVTVDPAFSVAQAMSVEGGRILAVGTDEQILAMRGPETHVIDLEGKTVLPGLIDSHVHPGAAMTEFDHPIP